MATGTTDYRFGRDHDGLRSNQKKAWDNKKVGRKFREICWKTAVSSFSLQKLLISIWMMDRSTQFCN
jgi:hypothetical protein